LLFGHGRTAQGISRNCGEVYADAFRLGSRIPAHNRSAEQVARSQLRTVRVANGKEEKHEQVWAGAAYVRVASGGTTGRIFIWDESRAGDVEELVKSPHRSSCGDNPETLLHGVRCGGSEL